METPTLLERPHLFRGSSKSSKGFVSSPQNSPRNSPRIRISDASSSSQRRSGEHSSRAQTPDDEICAADEKNPKTLSGFVDLLETELSVCLHDYRARAEEIIAQHTASLEQVQDQHEMQVAQVMSENAILRQKLGLKPSDQVQNIMFQNIEQNWNHQQQLAGKGRSKTAVSNFEDEDTSSRKKQKQGDTIIQNMRKHGAPGKQMPGGVWQTFLAWVPNGAALASPEPWKHLQKSELAQAAPAKLERGGGRRGPVRRTSSKESHNDELACVIPGSIPPSRTSMARRSSSAGFSEDDSNESDVNNEFELLEVFQAFVRKKKKVRTGGSAYCPSSAGGMTDAGDDFEQEHPVGCLLNPDSSARVSWDVLSLFMVVYDVIMIPLSVFTFSDNAFLTLMDWTTRLFWTFDIGWSCCTGVVLEDGRIAYDRKTILKRYAKSWLALDLVIVISDWIGLFMSSGDLGMGRLARVFRMARIARLVRLKRLQDFISSIHESIQSDVIALTLLIFQVLLVLAVLSHFAACGWWGIASQDQDADSWIKEYEVVNRSRGAQYLVVLHWALTQFSGGSSEISAVSVPEQVYCVFAGVTAFMVSLVMLSFLTSSLTQQYIIGGSGARQVATLKKYLRQNNISSNLTKRLCRNASHAISGELTADSVELLGVISEPLKIQMHFEMYHRVLTMHPLFQDLVSEDSQVIRRICHQAMSMILLASGDIIFSRGEEPAEPKMYFIVSGKLDYLDSYGETAVVEERQWLCEAVLWTHWRHRGTLTATSDVKMAMLDADMFHTICRRLIKEKKPDCQTIVSYATSFLEELNKEPYPMDLLQM
eukprot:TRINITY_DN35495_c0_g1_i1.p1 TRINITY_DN35495_c0_g1~~TRINITY_DN35495_c0_g1_i1.p1  ORF type:complete len:820 (-),score=120.67 TRINITY_DN35495_c0_g1_i1:80-2539(-)